MFSKEIEDRIRRSAESMERNGVLDDTALSVMYEQGLFKLFVPESFGGRMVSLPEAVRAFEDASRIDGSFGWAAAIGSGGGYFAACLEPGTAQEVFSRADAVIAGSGAPTGEAKRVPGGYHVSGRWRYCSGAPYATTFTAVAIADGGEALAFALRPEQVEIVADWRAFGLKATASHTIKVHDAFVEDARTFRADRCEYRNEPIYRVPFLPFAECSFAAVAIGIGKNLLEEAERMLETSQVFTSAEKGEQAAFMAARLASSEERMNDAACRFHDAVERAWGLHLADEAGETEEAAEAAWIEVGRSSKAAAAAALRAGQRLLPYLGLSAMMENQPINRIWRDLQTACQHKLLIDYE